MPQHGLFEACRVRHEVPHLNRLREALVRHLQRLRQIPVDRIAQFDLALFNQLHQRDPDNGFGNRSDATQCVGGHLGSRFQGRNAISLGQQNGVASHDCDADTGEPIPLHGIGYGAVHEIYQVCGIDGGAPGCRVEAEPIKEQHNETACPRSIFWPYITLHIDSSALGLVKSSAFSAPLGR